MSPLACTPEDRAVMVHLVTMIQNNPDVRYFVGCRGTRMRELLVAAIEASGAVAPVDQILSPPEHRKDDEPMHRRREKELDELRAAARAYLFGHYEDRDKARAALEALL